MYQILGSQYFQKNKNVGFSSLYDFHTIKKIRFHVNRKKINEKGSVRSKHWQWMGIIHRTESYPLSEISPFALWYRATPTIHESPLRHPVRRSIFSNKQRNWLFSDGLTTKQRNWSFWNSATGFRLDDVDTRVIWRKTWHRHFDEQRFGVHTSINERPSRKTKPAEH